MAKPTANYAVYLVTDSTPAILGNKDLTEIVEKAIQGGVTCVQYRDKDGEQSAVVATAKALHAITKKYNVPLLINDRVDVAAEIDCEGVHIGQDDMGKLVDAYLMQVVVHVESLANIFFPAQASKKHARLLARTKSLVSLLEMPKRLLPPAKPVLTTLALALFTLRLRKSISHLNPTVVI